MVHRALAESIALFEAGLAQCHRPDDRNLVHTYLAALAPVLAAGVLGEDVLGRLAGIERLVGNSWLVDQEPFVPAFAKWREFRTEYEAFAAGGMTVNERLIAFAVVDEYEQAVRDRDLQSIRAILRRVYVDNESIDRIVGKLIDDA